MASRFLLSELIVRTPAYLAYEHGLRRAIPHDETRFRIAGELLYFTENSPRRGPDERMRFRAELEVILGKAESDRLIFTAHKIYNGYRFVLHALRVVWLLLFLLGIWGLGRLFVAWSWAPYASLLAAAFVVGAILELGKWALLGLLAWKRI